MDKSELMTVVFVGYDGYSDMWNDCISLYNRFWDDCPYRTIFVNNVKDVCFPNVDVIHAGKNAEWSQKVRLVVQEAKTQYICLLLEDFLVGERINTKRIDSTIRFIKKEGIRYYKLANMSRAVKNRDPHYKGKRFLHIIPESDEYGVSLQAAIWDRNYLLELLGEGNYNAWIFEFNRVKEAQGKPDRPNPGCVFDDRNILNLQHGVIQSKYLPGTIRYFKNIGINLNVEREVMSWPHYYKLRLISKGKYIIPKKMRNTVKKILEGIGMSFVSTIRNKTEYSSSEVKSNLK